jgi:hypothetical protein
MLTLLAITVLGMGGPFGLPARELRNADITVARGSHVIAQTSEVGNMALRLRPGTYLLRASFLDASSRCEQKTVRIGRHSRHITLGCSIK